MLDRYPDRDCVRSPVYSPTKGKYPFTLPKLFKRNPDLDGALWLPESHKAFLEQNTSGVELVTNGRFDADISDWSSTGGTISHSFGRLHYLGPASQRSYTDAGLEVGKTYRITVDYEVVQGAIYIGVGNASFFTILSERNLTGTGSFSTIATIVDGREDGPFISSENNGITNEFYVDNVSTQLLPAGAQDAILYQDSAGTTPVTADGDPIGLFLDTSHMGGEPLSEYLAGQPELFTDGAVSVTDFGGSSGAYDAGTATMSNSIVGSSASYPRFTFDCDLTLGKRYHVKGQLSGDVSNVNQVRLATSGSANDLNYDAATGAINGVQVAGAVGINIVTDGTSTHSIVIESLSVKEVEDKHYQQTTDANRPTFEIDASGNYWVKGNGSNQFLRTAPFAYDAGSAYFGFAVRGSTPASDGYLYAEGNSANLQTSYGIYAATSGSLGIFLRNDAGSVLLSLSTATTVFDGQPHVLSVVDSGNSIRVWVDGVEDANSGTSYSRTGALTVDTGTLFAIERPTVQVYYGGEQIPPVIIEGGTDESTRKKIEAELAELSGATLLA